MGSEDWQEEVNFLMEDDVEAVDWLCNNSDWEDWKSDMIRVDDDARSIEHIHQWKNCSGFKVKEI